MSQYGAVHNAHFFTILLDSSRGFPQHLTLDVLKKEIKPNVTSNIQIYLNQFMDHHIYGISNQESKSLSFIPSVKKLYNLSDFTLWASLQIDGLVKSLGKNDQNPIISAKTHGGLCQFTPKELVAIVERMSPDVVISPVDPSLSMRRDTNEECKSTDSERYTEKENENNILSNNSNGNIQGKPPSLFCTTSSRLKYLTRWKSCMVRTFVLLDHFIKSNAQFSLLGSISTIQVRHADILREEYLIERLRESFSKVLDKLNGFSIQTENIEESTGNFMDQLQEVKIILEEIIFPLIIEKFIEQKTTENHQKRMFVVIRSTRFDMQIHLLNTYKQSWKNVTNSQSLLLSSNGSKDMLSEIWDKIDLILDTSFLSNITELGQIILPDIHNGYTMDINPHNTRHTQLTTSAKHYADFNQTMGSFLSVECTCMACTQNFHLSYIQHLFNTKEMLGKTLLSCHNIHTLLVLSKRLIAK